MQRPSDLLVAALSTILDEATEEYDLVIVDAPPVLGFAEPTQLATCVDGVVVVARAGKTNRKAVGNVLAILRRARANILGVVLNGYEEGMSSNGYSYGYYGYNYGADNAPAAGRTSLTNLALAASDDVTEHPRT